MRYLLASATGIMTAALGFSVTTIKGFLVCVTATFIVMVFYTAIEQKK